MWSPTAAHVEQVLELTGGHGAEEVIDFVGENGVDRRGHRDDPAGR